MTNLIIRQSTPDSGRLEGTIGGFILILTALAAVAMVWTRLEANVDNPTLEATFRAIDENSAMYNWHGTARLWFCGLLLASSYFISPALAQARAIGLRASRLFLTLAGIAMIVSGILTILPQASSCSTTPLELKPLNPSTTTADAPATSATLSSDWRSFRWHPPSRYSVN